MSLNVGFLFSPTKLILLVITPLVTAGVRKGNDAYNPKGEKRFGRSRQWRRDVVAAFRCSRCESWCNDSELRDGLPAALGKAGSLPYLGICLGWEAVKIWLPQALCSRACLKRLFPAHTGSWHRADRAGVDCHHHSHACRGGDYAFWLEELVKCGSLCVTLQGLNTHAVEAYVTCGRSSTWKERSRACCLWRRCLSHGREVFSS